MHNAWYPVLTYAIKVFYNFINHDTMRLLDIGYSSETHLNTLGPRQNDRHFPDDIFRCIFLNQNVETSINISLKFVSKGSVNNSSIDSDNGLAR